MAVPSLVLENTTGAQYYVWISGVEVIIPFEQYSKWLKSTIMLSGSIAKRSIISSILYLLQKLSELFGSSISGADSLLGGDHRTNTSTIRVLSWAVHLPAVLGSGGTHLLYKRILDDNHVNKTSDWRAELQCTTWKSIDWETAWCLHWNYKLC